MRRSASSREASRVICRGTAYRRAPSTWWRCASRKTRWHDVRGRHIRRLAAFCGIALDPALLALTLEQSSFEFMLAHRDHYDDLMMRQLVELRCGISGQKNAKVRQGRVGSHRSELSHAVAAAVDAKWRELITPSTGFETYGELSSILAQRE